MKGQACEFREIPLAEISANPQNPRKQFFGPVFDELVASVKEKGVIEPIIVRPRKSGKMVYETVAGERRCRAAISCGHATIPAIVRELTDEQAFDFMLIENLQREDLTEAEEAQSFQSYVGRHGEQGVKELAGRTGISPRYIRRRMAVLHLPEYVLEGWRKGKLKYGHLEQLLRVKDAPAKVKELFRLAAVQEDRWTNPATVEELKRRIDSDSPGLGLAYFPITPEGCGACPKNSMVQRDLFGIDDAQKSRCLDPACFKKRQNDWLLAHWKESPPGKKYGTTGFRFRDKVGYNDHETVRHHFPPDEKCKACPHFLTIIEVTGEVCQGDEQECFDKACLRSRTAKTRGEATSKEKRDGKSGEPRFAWHGEYFRDLFLKRRIPEVVGSLEPDGEKARTLLLAMAVHENMGVRDVVQKRLGMKDWAGEEAIIKKMLALPYGKLKGLMLESVSEAILQGGSKPFASGYSDGFGLEERLAVSMFLGIDLSKEWTVDEEYLSKKTRAECLAFIKKFNLHRDGNFRMYIQKTFNGRDVGKLKKGELVDLVLKSGVPLTGKVPDEILKEIK
jgi:ParB family chromosome partitioning protein